jgi:hypothetical protein
MRVTSGPQPVLGAIVKTVAFGLIPHNGIVVGHDDNGVAIIASISPLKGYTEKRLPEFLGRLKISRLEIPTLAGWVAARRARFLARKPYHLLNWNCQHFASFAAGRQPSSPAVVAIGGAFMLGFGLFALTRTS